MSDIRIDDTVYQRLLEQWKNLGSSTVKVGLFGKGPTPEENVAARGAVHEFGSRDGRIPERSFERTAFDGQLIQNEIFIQNLIGDMTDGKISEETVLKKIGVMHEGQIKKQITNGTYTDLSERTIKKKKSSKPLIDTGIMRNSVKFKISKRIID